MVANEDNLLIRVWHKLLVLVLLVHLTTEACQYQHTIWLVFLKLGTTYTAIVFLQRCPFTIPFPRQDLINIQIWLTLFSVWFYFSRPINLSQRARPAAFTVMTKCVMAHQSPRPLIRCCGGQMKVPSANREMAQGTARPKSPTLFELKTVSQYLGVVHWLFLKIFVYILGMQPYHLFF